MRIRTLTALVAATLAAPHPLTAQTTSTGPVTIYHQVTDLQVKDAGRGPAATIPLKVEGSAGLKIAFLARATGGINRVPLNVYDTRARDNTTAQAPAFVDETWRPVVYRCDRFRYNGGGMDDIVRADTAYESIRFFGPPTPGQQGVLYLKNVVVYRGDDTEPPAAPAQLAATPGAQGITLTWLQPRDNVGVARYVISRASGTGRFAKIAETSDVTFVDTSAPAGPLSYRVLAVDFQDNMSPWSASASTVATATANAPALTTYEQDRAGYATEVRRIHDAGVGRVVRGRVLQFGDSLSGATLYQLEAEAALGRYMVEARGRAGWTTRQGRGVIEQDLRELRPEFCLILYGTNNTKDRGGNRAAMDDLRFMTQACASAGAVPVVATIPPRGFQDPASRPEAEYNAELVKTFRAARVPIGYIFEQLQPMPDRHVFLAADGIHWARQAFRLTAGIWRDVMAQVQFALLDRPD